MDTDKRDKADAVAVRVDEAARRLGVSVSTVWRLLDRGALHRVRLGRSVRVLAGSIDKLASAGGAK